MDVFAHISFDEADSIMNKQKLCPQDVYRLQSFIVYSPLYSSFSDLTNTELMQINYLESKNIYRFMNAVAIICGIYGDARQTLFKTDGARFFINGAHEKYPHDPKLAKQTIFNVLIKYMLSGFSIQKSTLFEGRMPQKLFQFRQSTAEEWYNRYVNHTCYFSSRIYTDLGEEMALIYTLGSIAYYLNNSQPFKYYASSSDKNMNDAIYSILNKFISEVSGETTVIQKGMVFYKDL